jgi:uncharacterized protein YjbI with pentapeptide repeats
MTYKEELKQLEANIKQDVGQLYQKIKQYPLISLFFIIAAILSIAVPHWQVSGIDNATVQASQENQNRATLAQMFGGIAIAISLYYTWRRIGIAEEDLKAIKEGQITERFTRAVDQLGALDQFGNPSIEIRLGGIYALERIANESEKDYWPIIEILTAYLRKNSSFKTVENKTFTTLSMDIQANETTKKEIPYVDKMSLDVQAILTVIKRRKSFFTNGESIGLNLQKTHLRGVDLKGTHLEGAHLERADLKEAHLEGAHLEGADLKGAHLEGACLDGAHLERADLNGAHLEGAYLTGTHLEKAFLLIAHLEGAYLIGTYFEGAYLKGADLERAYLIGAHLEGAKNLSLNQLSKVNTLYKATLDEELLEPLKEQFPNLFDRIQIICKITEVRDA